VTARLATLPNILRARSEDVARLERHGALTVEMEARVAEAVTNMRRLADELEELL
jgi:hypothetical protein